MVRRIGKLLCGFVIVTVLYPSSVSGNSLKDGFFQQLFETLFRSESNTRPATEPIFITRNDTLETAVMNVSSSSSSSETSDHVSRAAIILSEPVKNGTLFLEDGSSKTRPETQFGEMTDQAGYARSSAVAERTVNWKKHILSDYSNDRDC